MSRCRQKRGLFHFVDSRTGVCHECGWDSIGETTRRARAALPEVLIAVLRREGTRRGEHGWWLMRIAELADALDVERLAELADLHPMDFEAEEALLAPPATTAGAVIVDDPVQPDPGPEARERAIEWAQRHGFVNKPIQPRPDFETEAVRRAKRGPRRSHPRYPLPDDLDDLPFEDEDE